MLVLVLVLASIGVLALLALVIYLYRPIYRPKYLDNLYDIHVLITGGSSGIGKELARQLLHEYGARVTIIARNRDRLEECRQELTPNSSDRLLCLSVDISESYDEVFNAVQQAIHHHQDRPVDILINNAGIFYARPFRETRPEEFNEMSETMKLFLACVDDHSWTFLFHSADQLLRRYSLHSSMFSVKSRENFETNRLYFFPSRSIGCLRLYIVLFHEICSERLS